MTAVAGPFWHPLMNDHPELAGVFVGGCVERGIGSRFRHQAHAHTGGLDFPGWVCVLSRRRLFTASGGPSQLMLHELAHVLTGHGHDDVWRAKCREVGYRIQAHERKRPRR